MKTLTFENLETAAHKANIKLDATDYAIFQYLAEHKDATVTQLKNAIEDVSRTVVFYRLLTFKGAGLVTSSRKSRNSVIYSLSPQAKAVISQ